MTGETGRRGRPPLHELDELEQQALEIILRDGYANVTMGGVAVELGMSLRTLHRYFPSKADLVWRALDDTFVRLGAYLAEGNQNPSVMAAIGAAIVASFSAEVDEDPSGRDRLRLIATIPALRAAKSDAFGRWQDELIKFAATRLGLSPDDVEPQAIATAAQSAAMAGLAWWATHENVGKPADVVARALRALEDTAAPALRTSE